MGPAVRSVPGFANILMSDPDGRKAWFDGLYVQVDRPYGGAGRVKYGFSVTYTLGHSEQTGGNLFSLDFPGSPDYPAIPPAADERHRLVMTGIAGLPYGVDGRARSSYLGSGTPYADVDISEQGGGVNQRRLQRNGGRPGAVHVRHSRCLGVPQPWICSWRRPSGWPDAGIGVGDLPGVQHFQLRRLSGYQGIIPDAAGDQPEFRPGSNLIDPGRRVQFGVRYGF